MAIETWLALLALFFVGGLTPGPAVMLVMSAAFRHGFWRAMCAGLGIASANVIWLALAASGAAALAATYPQGFAILKLLGLAVILWLGLSIMRAPVAPQGGHEGQGGKGAQAPSADIAAPDKSWKLPLGLYVKGLALQLANPMALVTFAGILPAFFDTARPILPQFIIMITTLTYLELQGLAVYAAFGKVIRAKLSTPKAARRFNYIIGAILIIAGIAAIMFTW